jgi:hypothetical protein
MNSVPLTDVLPWGFDKPPAGGRTTLICDSSETDGRFLLHTIASQCLSSSSSTSSSRTPLASSSLISSSASLLPAVPNKNSNASVNSQYNILWINCGLKTEAQIYAAMKKIGCDVRTNESLVHIMTIRIPTDESLEENENSVSAEEKYLKGFYQDIQRKTSSMSNYIIIVDDATLLSTYFGPSLTYAFIQMLKGLIAIRKQNTIGTSTSTIPQIENDAGLIIRASHDLDQEHYLHSNSTHQEQKSVTGNKVLNYIGAGGKGILHDSESLAKIELGAQYELEEMVWERSLVELADGVIDVVPLASGFAKDVHGRLIFTSKWGAGLGWKKNDNSSTAKNNFSTTLVNFCCSDAGVRAIRLRV